MIPIILPTNLGIKFNLKNNTLDNNKRDFKLIVI